MRAWLLRASHQSFAGLILKLPNGQDEYVVGAASRRSAMFAPTYQPYRFNEIIAFFSYDKLTSAVFFQPDELATGQRSYMLHVLL